MANAFGLVLLLVLAAYILASLTPSHGWTAVLTILVASAAAVVLAALAAIVGGGALLGAGWLITALLLLLAAGAILRTVLAETQVGFRTILGAISVYTILGLLFTFLYAAIDRIQSSPFFGSGVNLKGGDFLFFSFTTLTTTGYGNLVPAGQPGKMFAGLEMLMGQIFLVTLVAGLVSLWRPRGRTQRSSAS